MGLEEALKVGVVEDQSRGTIARYRFTHAFFRQTLYEETITPRRIRLHQQVAQALQTQYSARLEEHVVELAEHFAFYTESEGLAKAVDYGEMAARRAMSVFDYGEASRLREQAIGVQEVLDPDDKAKLCDLLLSLGDALNLAGEPQRVFEALALEALALAEALDDQDRASQTCQMAMRALVSYGSTTMRGTPQFRQWVERTDRYAAPGTIHRVNADIAIAHIAIQDGRFAEGRSHLQLALKLARQLDDPETLFHAAYLMLGPQGGPQHEEERFQLMEEFTRRPRDGSRPVRWCKSTSSC